MKTTFLPSNEFFFSYRLHKGKIAFFLACMLMPIDTAPMAVAKDPIIFLIFLSIDMPLCIPLFQIFWGLYLCFPQGVI